MELAARRATAGSIDPDVRLRDLALGVEGAWRVLGAHHLDYCCGGARSLRDACERAGVPLAEVIAEIERERARVHGARSETRWLDHAPWELVEHLLDTHHAFTWSELERLSPLATKVARAHGERHPELAEVERLLGALRAELEPHLREEENVLFPYVLSLRVHDAEGTTPPPPPFGTLAAPIDVMRRDHDAAGAILERLRGVTRAYDTPSDACGSYRALYAGLAELDRDVVRHVSLENDVLFPMLLARAS